MDVHGRKQPALLSVRLQQIPAPVEERSAAPLPLASPEFTKEAPQHVKSTPTSTQTTALRATPAAEPLVTAARSAQAQPSVSNGSRDIPITGNGPPAEPAFSPPSSAVQPERASAPLPGLATTAPNFAAQYLNNPRPRYPTSARRAGQEGTVFLKVLVSADGRPRQVQIDRSSGWSALDAAAMDAVRIWRFVPAKRSGEVIDQWTVVPVEFRLEEG